MDELILNALKSHSLFASISETDLQALMQYIQYLSIMPGEVLFKQGDVSDSLYFLISGRLAAVLSKPGEPPRMVGEVKHGEAVGELGLLSDRPRTLTITAMRESQLIKLTKYDFELFCEKHPKVWPKITSTIVTRSQNILRDISGSFPFTNIALLCANESTPLNEFIAQLKTHFISDASVHFVTKDDFKGTTLTNIENISHHMSALEDQYDFVFYIIHPNEDEWAQLCFDYVDRVILAAPGHSAFNEAKKAFYILNQYAYQRSLRTSLLLLYESTQIAPYDTAKWLDQYTFYHHHHICYNDSKHMQRIVRILTGRANGLVLGGGGARGWAEIGVIKAMREYDIPIDLICGVSIGSIIAACYANTYDFASFYQTFNNLAERNKKPVRLRNLTLPIISLLNGKPGTLGLRQAFGEQQIEDMWQYYFCVSTALNSGKDVVHFRGPLWKYIRASVSLPGIYPPVVDGGELLVDGGVANNLPTDHMKRALENAGRIISVDISSRTSGDEAFNFPPVLTFWQLLLYKLKIKHHRWKFPTLLETLLESLLMGSSIRTANNQQLSDIVIRPELQYYKMMDQSHAEKIFAIGYEAACAAFKEHVDVVQRMKET